MKNEKVMENKKEDKKALYKFLPMLLLCMLGGGIVGLCLSMFGNHIAGIGMQIDRMLAAASYGNYFVITIMVVIIYVLEQKCRTLYKKWDGENETEIAKVEKYLGYGMVIAGVQMILTYFFFGTGVYTLYSSLPSDKNTILKFTAVVVAGLFYALLVTMLCQNRLVNFIKEINPEKSGSVYDMKFKDKWLKSCDEAERYKIYECSYKAFSAANMCCIVLWAFCIVGMMCWDFGILPMVMVIIIWGVPTLTYCKEVI